MASLPETIRQYISEELRGVYTTTLCVVESVDQTKQRVELSFKRDKEVVIDDVPLASPFADADGYGEIRPIASGDEGVLFHTKEPMDDLTVEAGHRDLGVPTTQFRPQDGVFFPCFWNDNDTKPTDNVTDFTDGEWVVVHPSDTVIRIKTDGSALMYRESSGDELGLKLDANTGSFALLESDGYGIEGDGSGNFTWYAESVDITDKNTGTLL